jgi:hypothetical protein
VGSFGLPKTSGGPFVNERKVYGRTYRLREHLYAAGKLGHVSKHPNLDFLVSIFNIPRVYTVLGFGTWNVGQHTMAVAFLSLYWSAFNSYPQEIRDPQRMLTFLTGCSLRFQFYVAIDTPYSAASSLSIFCPLMTSIAKLVFSSTLERFR